MTGNVKAADSFDSPIRGKIAKSTTATREDGDKLDINLARISERGIRGKRDGGVLKRPAKNGIGKPISQSPKKAIKRVY
ncbi:MAG: hypothetical protein SynsKO_06200 [Synoicihabitans sp.]